MILVVGGHSRNVGKTSVMANLIRAFADRCWTAIKITQFGHGVCSSTGEDCECAIDPDHPFALRRELDSTSGADTSRYLAAGAKESIWLRTRTGDLGYALPALRRILERVPDVIIESNSVMQFIKPDLYLVVLDPEVHDFKTSSRTYLDRADAVLVSGQRNADLRWKSVSPRLFLRCPAFYLGPQYSIPGGLRRWIEEHESVTQNSQSAAKPQLK